MKAPSGRRAPLSTVETSQHTEDRTMTDSIYSQAGAQISVHRTDLVTCHGCAYVGSGADASGDPFDLYHDPETGLIFKVVSDSNVDTVIYGPDAELN